jgi:hypothetical protein
MTIVTTKRSIQDYHQMIETGLLNERKVELVTREMMEMSPEGTPPQLTLIEIQQLLA